MTYTGRQYQIAEDTAPPKDTNPAVVELDDGTDVQVIRIDTGTSTTPTPASVSNPVPTSVQSSALPTGAATAANQAALLVELQAKADLTETQPVGAGFLDTGGGYHGFINNAGAPQVCSQDYLLALGEGDISGHSPWSMYGYNPTVATTEADIWSYGATQPAYVFPTAEMGMEVLSSDNTQDIGTVIKGNADFATVTSDAGGTTTSLLDADVDFTAATAVAAGDIVLLDGIGASPEWGYVTAVTAHELTIGNGFSSGGTGASRKYAVLDYSAKTGAMAGLLHYLDANYIEHKEIIIYNGTTVVPTLKTNIFRVNDFYTIATGSGGKSVGSITLRHIDNTPVYAYMTAGYNRARKAIETVPAGKTLYIVQWSIGWATPNDTKVQTARFMAKANVEPEFEFRTGLTFYTHAEAIVSNAQTQLYFPIPFKIPAKTDMKISGIAFTGGTGPAVTVARGWLE